MWRADVLAWLAVAAYALHIMEERILDWPSSMKQPLKLSLAVASYPFLRSDQGGRRRAKNPRGGGTLTGRRNRLERRAEPRFFEPEAAMEKFTSLEGVAAPLKLANVDTDKIIPKQYLKTIKRTGLGKGLFAEMRYQADGSENPDFVLNKPAYRKAKILVAGDNFGCGSSREHAPWALLDFGLRCVIS